jgi:transglutaminase-like putative cysteine protease
MQFREGWLILILLSAMVVSPGVAMRWADWVPGLWVLQVIPLVAVGAGLALAKSRFSSGVALALALVYGVFTVGFFCGQLLPADMPWHARIPDMVSRQIDWLGKAANVIMSRDAADTSRDGMIFIMQTGFLLWIIGYSAAWYTFRRLAVWRATLPTALLLLLTTANYYGPEPMGVVLTVFVLLMLAFIVASHYLIREQAWKRARVVFSRGTRWDFVQTGVLIALVVMPVAWLIPNISAGETWREVSKPLDTTWQRVQDGWTQLFASLKSYGGEYSDPFGNSMTMGGPRQIEPVPIMDIKTGAGRYWRGIVYGTYTGDAWINSESNQVVVSPDAPLEMARFAMRRPITATVTTYLANSGLIYFPHQPDRTDRQAKFTVIDMPDGEIDAVNALSRYVLYEGQTYQSWGSVSVATEASLRRAGTTYPAWVKERYLRVPPGLSPRISELATAIAGSLENPYDRADTLTQWLRTNLTYNEAVQAPPVGVDPLEYLLFESKEGYCTYYASALAIMLRTLGVPTRVAAGYAQGSWQEDAGIYRVYSTDAHTWVEVFFPGYGWVEFEPTASQPAIVRTGSASNQAGSGSSYPRDRDLPEEGPEISDGSEYADDESLSGLDTLAEEEPLPMVGLIGGAVVVLLALVIGVGMLVSERQSAGGLSLVAQVYDRMSRFAKWIGVLFAPSQTPYERAAVLSSATPEGASPIAVITDLYVEERFGRVREGTFDERAAVAWLELRSVLFRRSLLHALSRVQQKDDKIRRYPRG